MAKTKNAAVPAPSMSDDHKWQAQSDLRTLMDAHAIRNDKARHGRAKAHAKEQLAALKTVTAPAAATPPAAAPAMTPTE